jgi:hypothetical protein
MYDDLKARWEEAVVADSSCYPGKLKKTLLKFSTRIA